MGRIKVNGDQRLRATIIAAIAVVVGCSTGSAPGAPSSVVSASPPALASSSAAPSETPASPAASQAAIVGEWVGTQDCERIVAMLRKAGRDESLVDAIYGNELVPGMTGAAAIKDPAHPCAGAILRQHSHYFTASGAFGSKDFRGKQVDDGTYKLQGTDVIVIDDSRFHYRIEGDELSLEPEPVDISACTTQECRFGATWVLMVAMPGTTWKRGTIPG